MYKVLTRNTIIIRTEQTTIYHKQECNGISVDAA